MAFDKECHDNLRRSEEMLDEMDEHKQNMTRTMQEIDDLEAGLDQVKLEISKNLSYKTLTVDVFSTYLVVNYTHKKTPLLMFDKIVNKTLLDHCIRDHAFSTYENYFRKTYILVRLRIRG